MTCSYQAPFAFVNAITIYTATNKRYLNESTDLIVISVQCSCKNRIYIIVEGLVFNKDLTTIVVTSA
ncbi:hypothetical protein KOSB73_260276 [Klebsiella grimontii]|uniref:Uncharacterized protein n=1 Tax=Klebsiella grimontii TaxID=2058152 RepID=A0A285B3U9_9ENTR|nr:hypothetical protein KOSB73_260276 [Klebsiella grimontii]